MDVKFYHEQQHPQWVSQLLSPDRSELFRNHEYVESLPSEGRQLKRGPADTAISFNQ